MGGVMGVAASVTHQQKLIKNSTINYNSSCNLFQENFCLKHLNAIRMKYESGSVTVLSSSVVYVYATVFPTV
jgi:hypothetical protein